MVKINRYIAIGFALGVVAVVAAFILFINQYSLSPLVINRPCIGSYSINVRGDVVILINNTGNVNESVSIVVYQHIPQTNITIPQEYNVSLTPLNVTDFIYGNVYGVEITCNSTNLSINAYLLKRPPYYVPLWLTMIISFVVSLAMIITGYLVLVESSIESRR